MSNIYKNYVATPDQLQELKADESRCIQCKTSLPEEHPDWYPIEYCPTVDIHGQYVRAHSWLCPKCAMHMNSGISTSFSIEVKNHE